MNLRKIKQKAKVNMTFVYTMRISRVSVRMSEWLDSEIYFQMKMQVLHSFLTK